MTTNTVVQQVSQEHLELDDDLKEILKELTRLFYESQAIKRK